MANGLLYRLPDQCKCYMAFQPRGLLAMTSDQGGDNSASETGPAGLLKTGPACREATGTEVPRSESVHSESSDDWPTFRHDPMRSGCATTSVSSQLQVSWQQSVGDSLTAPVVAGGKLYCCRSGAHTVHALDAATGRELWSFVADGRVDSPPSVYNGLCHFGCADGWVYCLRASDGQLAWRYRVAPHQRTIVADGRLESAWPVHGSVLVRGRVVYATAGRCSLLDGGVYAYALDAETGRVLDRQRITEEQTDTLRTGRLPQGALSDILVSDGEAIYLRHRKLHFTMPRAISGEERFRDSRPHLMADGGLFDTHWFHRANWSLNGKITGRIIVFDESTAYVCDAYGPGSRGNNNFSYYVPRGGRRQGIVGDNEPSLWGAPADIRQGGYALFASGYTSKTQRPLSEAGQPNQWNLDEYPLCPWAMTVCGDTLFVAGFPDTIKADDPWATFEGRGGGRLHALSAKDGTILSEYDLDSPPVWNGMAAARKRLYLSTRGGQVLCFSGQEP